MVERTQYSLLCLNSIKPSFSLLLTLCQKHQSFNAQQNHYYIIYKLQGNINNVHAKQGRSQFEVYF